MKALLAVALLSSLTLAGCASTNQNEPVTPEMKDGKYVIHMTAGSQFRPQHAKVPAGATVVWVNDGGVHDVSADDDSWSTDDALGKKMVPGESWERTFAQPGKVPYNCRIHASTGMRGTLTVE
jgi:plastocyanin